MQVKYNTELSRDNFDRERERDIPVVFSIADIYSQSHSYTTYKTG